MKRPEREPRRWAAPMLVVSVLLAGCADSSSETDDAGAETVMVEPDYGAPQVVINVTLTDDGFDPETILIPAGRHVRLVLRNRGTQEHHFRIARLVASDVRWFLTPEVSEDELLEMTEDELVELGVGDAADIDDPEHVVHHLQGAFVPFKETSRAGITPLKNEVHGYAHAGETELITFFALGTGTFTTEDVLHPDITGTAVVLEVGE